MEERKEEMEVQESPASSTPAVSRTYNIGTPLTLEEGSELMNSSYSVIDDTTTPNESMETRNGSIENKDEEEVKQKENQQRYLLRSSDEYRKADDTGSIETRKNKKE